MQEFFQLNTLPFGIVVFMLIIIQSNHNYEPDIAKRFLIPIVLLIFVMIDDNIDYYLFHIHDTGVIHRITAVIGYDLRITILVGLMFIVLRHDNSKYKTLRTLPGLVCILLTSLAPVTNLVFWYDKQTGAIMRGPLAFTPHITLALYVVYLCYLGIRLMIARKTEEGLVILFGCFLNMMATAVEFAFALRGILMGAIALVIVFYYMCLHTEYFKIDVLTGALNRISFIADSKRYEGTTKAIIMIDLNNLKQLNDKQGHDSGDKALKALVFIVSRCLPRGCYLYRTGGDEFVVICTKRAKESIAHIADRISKAMYATNYSWAVGYSDFGENDTFDGVLKRADENMYRNKRQMKSDVR